jgi:hypothetical protein
MVRLIAMSSSGDVFITERDGVFRLHHTMSDTDPEVIEEAEAKAAPLRGGLRVVDEELEDWEALDIRRRELAISISVAPAIPADINARAMLPGLRRSAMDPNEAGRAHRLASRFAREDPVLADPELCKALIDVMELANTTITPSAAEASTPARQRWNERHGVMALQQ